MIVMGVAYALLGLLRFAQIIYRSLRTSKDVPITEEEGEEQPTSKEPQMRNEPRGHVNIAATITEEDSDAGSNASSSPPTEHKSSGVTFDLPTKPRRVLFQEPEPEVESEPEVVEDEKEDNEDEDDDGMVALPVEEPIKMNIITLIECIILIFLGVWFVAGGWSYT